ncbi:MAG: hypothetical protein LBL07_03525, partial [Tannerella sp.]|nr:hypothetical protein [Tannerella sp.]
QHARLEEPQEAYAILHRMLTDISIHPRAEDSQVTPSFEGNQAIQGITAGIAEMLMQSHSSELSLLPALPSQWPTGEITGLRARGGYDVSLAWRDGQLSAANITAQLDNTCRLRTRIPVKALSGKKEIPVKQLDDCLIEFEIKAGERIRIIPK